jgi:hypothetical protein
MGVQGGKTNFSKVGMVTIFGFQQTGKVDLIVIGEWMKPTFANIKVVVVVEKALTALH